VALILPAYAKLNLTLDVLGRRANGYHEIDSVMQTISLHDLIWIESTDCRVFDVVGGPIEGENLVLKAARELEGRLGRALPFTIRLFKRIPIGAGLGGGSSDAAAFLNAANQLYGLKLKWSELVEIATEIGQDVPFFLRGGTAHATGLGSTVAPLPPVPSSWRFLVVCPPVQISTRQVYDAVDGTLTSAARTPKLVEMLTTPSPETPQTLASHVPRGSRGPAGPPTGGREKEMGNDLEPVTRRLFPAFNEAIESVRKVVPGITMSGTGAALFALFDTRREAEAALTQLRKMGYPTWLCRPVPALT
jgi:4-diphosphocytidyl-2-C-methyl-D-erythritol kinase